MKLHYKLQTAALIAGLLLLPLAKAADMTEADYALGKTRISATYKAAESACNALAGNAKDICAEQALGNRRVALAELESGRSGKIGGLNKVAVAQADANFAVAKERSDDTAGNVKDVCMKEAEAAHTSALADARMGKQIGEARTEAADEKRNAEFKVAIEKCDAASGDAKSQCVVAAKTKFGKN